MIAPQLRYCETSTPLGPMTVIADDSGALVALDFAASAGSFTLRRLNTATDGGRQCLLDALGTTARALGALDEYFAGRRRDFSDLPMAMRGTPFQLAVWAELRRIPFGETRSYGQLAAALGKPGASRAVGRANGANPLPLIVPCHRVIGANGALTGFSAVGGVATKRWLLNFERSAGGAGQCEMNFDGIRATLPAAHAAEPSVVAPSHL